MMATAASAHLERVRMIEESLAAQAVRRRRKGVEQILAPRRAARAGRRRRRAAAAAAADASPHGEGRHGQDVSSVLARRAVDKDAIDVR